MSGVTLSSEFAALDEAFAIGLGEMEWLTINALKSAFAPFDERLRLINEVVKPGYARLRAERDAGRRRLTAGPADRPLRHGDQPVGHDVGRQAAAGEKLVEGAEARGHGHDVGRLLDRDVVAQVALLGQAAGEVGLARPAAVLDRRDRGDGVRVDGGRG